MQRRPSLQRSRRIAVAFVVAVVLAIAGFVAKRAAERWLHRHVEAELARTFGRPIRVSHVSLAARGLSLDGVSMPRRGHEPADPFVARRAWLATDWWQYLRTRSLRVTSVSVEDIHIDVPHPEPGPAARPWTEGVVAFSHDGLRHFELHRGTIVAYDANARRALVVDGVDGVAELSTWAFSYRFEAETATFGARVATSLRGAGRGNPRLATLDEGRVRLAGADLTASARYDAPVDTYGLHVVAGEVDLDRARSLVPPDVSVRAAHGRVATEITAEIARGDLSSLEATVRGSNGWLELPSGTIPWTSLNAALSVDPRGMVRATGAARLDRKAVDLLRRESPISSALAELRANFRAVALTFTISFPRTAPSEIEASGRVHLDDPSLQLARTLAPFQFRTADADLHQTSGVLRIEHLSVHDGAVALHGSARVRFRPGRRPVLDLDGVIDVADLRALRVFVPQSGSWPAIVATLPNGRGRAVMHARASVGDPDSVRIGGTLETGSFLDGIHFPLPSHTTLEVPERSARARFAFAAGRGSSPDLFSMTDIHIDGPMGDVSGHAELVGDRFHVFGEIQNGDHKVIDWLVPGNIGGGTFAGTIDIHGDGSRGVEQMSGGFDARNARYVPPGTMHLVGPPIEVAQFSGEYHWWPEHSTIDHVVLRGSAMRGTGSFDIRHGSVRIRADLNTRDAGRVADYWPALHGLFRGGNGDARLDLTVHNEEARGTLAFVSEGGALIVPHATGREAVQPMTHGAGTFVFAPDLVGIRGLSVRGPQVNGDLSGAWPDGKTVHLMGRLWLTPQYSSRLMGRWHVLARVVGIRSISTDFRIFGTTDRVMMSAGITRSLVWRLGHGTIPRDVQEMLTARRPINEADATGGGPGSSPAPR